MSTPDFSIVTPCLNSGNFLPTAIQSVAKQEHVAAEHIVIDGASTDNTLEALKGQSHLFWTSEPDQGQSDAINKGFLRAKGDLVGWLNADDYYLPGGLGEILDTARRHPEGDVFYGDCVFVDSDGRIIRSKVEHSFDQRILLHFGCYIPSTATFMRRRVLQRGFLLDSKYRVCMDFEYFARLAHAGCKFLYVPRFIAAFRWHDDNVSLKQSARRLHERLEVQKAYGLRGHQGRVSSLLSHAHRGKRLLRKIITGNVLRELGVNRLRGRDTLWTERLEARETCASLASL